MPQPFISNPSTAFQRADLPEQKDERRQLLLRAAADEIASLGSDKDFTINSLAQRAGLAKGTVYLYFPSKGAIVLELLMETTDLLVDELLREIKALPEPISAAALAAVLMRSFDHIETTRQFSRLFKSTALTASDREQLHHYFMPRLLELEALLLHRLPQLKESEGVEIMCFSWALFLGHMSMEDTEGDCDFSCEPKIEPKIGLTRLVQGYLHRPQEIGDENQAAAAAVPPADARDAR